MIPALNVLPMRRGDGDCRLVVLKVDVNAERAGEALERIIHLAQSPRQHQVLWTARGASSLIWVLDGSQQRVLHLLERWWADAVVNARAHNVVGVRMRRRRVVHNRDGPERRLARGIPDRRVRQRPAIVALTKRHRRSDLARRGDIGPSLHPSPVEGLEPLAEARIALDHIVQLSMEGLDRRILHLAQLGLWGQHEAVLSQLVLRHPRLGHHVDHIQQARHRAVVVGVVSVQRWQRRMQMRLALHARCHKATARL
mmetsp:Transcript_26513/g.88339  ORF Transcript_26513/g.88339 Transcript_26513/m.88339 type:complete len:255 (-) Transcript_26513:1763-2527(-)